MPRTIGLMSGTSLDGVDAAWLETDGVSIGGFGPTTTIAYDPTLRRDLRTILDRAPLLSDDDAALADVVVRLTDYHIQAVQALGRPADLIGFHGQTILHQPDKRRTWQIGDAQRLAQHLGVPVAHGFRLDDVAAGGQGAPLAPVFHQALAQTLEKPLAILNIGGVANVTLIGSDGALLAFDTGPGNALLDDWALRHTGTPFDEEGRLASRGQVDHGIVARLLELPYFRRSAPKSLDRLDFAGAVDRYGVKDLSAEDGAATLTWFTVEAVAAARFPVSPQLWVVCGGGRHNPLMMAGLRQRLGVDVISADAVGWDGNAIEAQCFGYLAARIEAGLPISFPGTTGVKTPLTGGRIVRPS
jgi:anhydro-N-acetylmuramic acid kinase